MFLPLQSKPAARGANRRRHSNPRLFGLLPQQDDDYGTEDSDDAAEAADSEESGE
jgi:hypothetical protein